MKIGKCYLALVAGSAMASTAMAQNTIQTAAKPLGSARNVIFFVGDGMGVSTVTATRVYSVGVDGELVVDQMPFTALSKTYTSDHITPDSAGTMTAMMSGVNTNSGVIGYPATTERGDFNGDGDGTPVTTLLELAEGVGMKTGVVSTARITHATPAACYSHVNDRGRENDIVLQALPTDPAFNPALGDGIEVMFGGGRRHFLDSTMTGDEGGSGSRNDGRDLRAEFQAAGYTYVWNQAGFDALSGGDLPVLGLFERSHMEYEFDRPNDLGGEPSVTEMTTKAIEMLAEASQGEPRGYFLMVESGRIDHAHHAGNAWRSMVDTEEFDEAIGAAINAVNLRDTLIIVTADHSHVFNIAGYPLRAAADLPYTPISMPGEYQSSPFNNIFDIVFGISGGNISPATDSNGVPYTTLGYLNGPGYRGVTARVDPATDPFPGLNGQAPMGPNDPEYRQEAAIPLGSETHSGEEVAIYAIGRGAGNFRGTVKNTRIFDVMKGVLGL